MAQFRLGILSLEAETGRFNKIELERRICKIWKEGFKAEVHFLFLCDSYIELSNQLFTLVMKEIPEFITFYYEDRLRVLFDKYHRQTAKYLK